MAKLGDRVLGEFQLGGAAVIAESAPILAASAPQDESFSRVLEKDEVIMTNTFISPVFDGTQNLVRAGDTVAFASVALSDVSSTSVATGEILTRNIAQLFEDVESSASAGDVAMRQAAVLADSIPRQIFEDEPILSQTEFFGNEESLTRDGDTVGSVMSPLDDSLSRNIDGRTVAPLISSLDESFSRLFQGEGVLRESSQLGDSLARTFEEDEVIMSNTFISPVFNGTQNLVRDGNIATATSLALQISADITAGQLLSLNTIPQFDGTDTNGSAGDVLGRTGIQSFDETNVSASSGNIISRVALEFLVDGIISGSGGDVVSLQGSILDDSFSRNLFTDEPLLRPTTVLTDSFSSTLEEDIALTIQSAVFSEEFTASTDGDVQLRNASVLDNSFSRLFDGSVLDRQALTIGNVFTRTFEEDEIIMSNMFIAPVFDGTQNLVRAGNSVFAQSNTFLPTTGITAGKLLTRETDVLFNETDILASTGDVLERVVDNLLEESQTSAISGDVLQRTLNKVFDESLIVTTDGNTVSLLSVEFGDVETFGGFTDEPILLNATVSVESTAITDDVDNVLSAQSVILDESISRNDDGDIVGVSSDVFGEIFSQTVDGGSVLPNQTAFTDTFTRTFEEDETIMSNTFFAPVFDGTQNLVRSGDTIDSTATELDSTIGLTTGDSVLAHIDLLFNESNTSSLDGDTVLGQSIATNPEYSFIANPGVVTRELGAGSPQLGLGGSQIGFFELGLGDSIDGTILRANALTFRTAIVDIVSRAGMVVGKGVGRKFVDALIASTLAEPVIEKSIGRKFDGDVVQIDFEEFVDVFTRTFDGRTATALASQIEAFRVLTEWALGQRQLGTIIEETREWSALELVYQFKNLESQQNDPESFSVEEATNDLKARSEKVSVRELIDGGFTGVDLSGEGNTFNIRAPFDRDDVRPVDEWFVNSVDVENISRDTNTFEVELELVPEKSKEFDNEYGTFESPEIQSPSVSQWTFEFEFGTIATRRVTVETTESSSGTLDVQELELVLQPEQVRIFEENVSHLNLVYERSVPDGFDIVDDTSSDERNTVQISPPANVNESVVEGEYSFVSWETEWRAGTFVCTWEVATDEN